MVFQISPNPIHNQLNIDIDKVQNSQYRILLIQTILGNTVKVIPIKSSSDFITIDMSNFPNAPYIVSLICKDFTLSKKIVKWVQ